MPRERYALLRHLGQVVDLLPGEDPLAVGLRARERPRCGAGGDDDRVGPERLVPDLHGEVGPEAAATLHDAYAVAVEPGRDVGRLVGREPLHAGVDPAQVDRDRGRRVALLVVEVDPELLRGAHVGHQLGRGDQRLARHAVGEHRRAADAVGVDDGDLGAELRGDVCGLVAAGSAADDDDVVSHEALLPASGVWVSIRRDHGFVPQPCRLLDLAEPTPPARASRSAARLKS
jgi:hypothetical protein